MDHPQVSDSLKQGDPSHVTENKGTVSFYLHLMAKIPEAHPETTLSLDERCSLSHRLCLFFTHLGYFAEQTE